VNSMAGNEKIRDLKRPYRKKALQSGYSQAGDAVDAYPPAISSVSTTTTQQTEVVRPGMDPTTYKRDIRPAVEFLERSVGVNYANYPWHLVPKFNSANVTLRYKYDFSTGAGYNLATGQYLDVVVLNVADIEGSNSWTDLAGTGQFMPTPTTFTGVAPPPQVRSTTGTATAPPTAANNNKSLGGIGGSNTVTATSTSAATGRTSTVGNRGDYYHIASFGHTEALDNAGIYYQIWVDGSLYQEWNNFQWSAITPKADQWHYDIPIVATSQVVFRVINASNPGVSITTGTCEACFCGWTEQRDYTQDVGRQQNVQTN